MFTEVHLGEEDGGVALGAVAERSDGEVLVVVRVRGREVRVAARELLPEPLAVRVLVDGAVLREVEGLESTIVVSIVQDVQKRKKSCLVDDRGSTRVVAANFSIEELATQVDGTEPGGIPR